MMRVAISVAADPVAEGRFLVVAWLAVTDSRGDRHTRGIAELWVGNRREGLARIAAEALRALKQPCDVALFVRTHERSEPAPSATATADLAREASRHRVKYVVVPQGAAHDELEAAERFAAARAAGVRVAAPEGVRAGPAPPAPRRLF